jgi:hypothetical protein
VLIGVGGYALASAFGWSKPLSILLVAFVASPVGVVIDRRSQ